jgi:hypothetical protein
VDSILRRGLDRLPVACAADAPHSPAAAHENVRGGSYYQPASADAPQEEATC